MEVTENRLQMRSMIEKIQLIPDLSNIYAVSYINHPIYTQISKLRDAVFPFTPFLIGRKMLLYRTAVLKLIFHAFSNFFYHFQKPEQEDVTNIVNLLYFPPRLFSILNIFRSSQYLDYGFRIPLGVFFLFKLFIMVLLQKKKKKAVLFMIYLFLVSIIIYCNICSIQTGKKTK